MSRYVGSPAKVLVRAACYDRARRKIGERRFKNELHIVIASRECGDISYLMSHGVPAANILACDTDPTAVRIAASFGVKVSNYPTIEDTVGSLDTNTRLATVNVDLCRSLPTTIGALTYIMDSITGEAPVFFTYFRARDRMCGEYQRELFLRKATGRRPDLEMPYQSKTWNSKGSPMMTVVFDE